ncbi:hypothetical protein HYS96_02620 [Candidatus Daviesbacteria bacterium]|nr:hypothetical protein [Candidatus Daviesbacteria bacterium]
MKRFKIYDLRFKIFLLLFSLILLFINHKSYFINHTYAADSTPSAEIQVKLEELKKDIASKAAKIKKDVDRKLKDKAYAGKIKTISNASIAIAAHSGPKIASINQDTVFESNVKGRKYSQKLMRPEDFIVAMGDVDETAVLTAKKVILLPEKEEVNKVSLWGQVIAISDKLLTVKNKDGKNIAVALPSGSTVKLNEFLILTGQHNKNEIFTAEFVYIIPQGGILKPKKVGSPSAQLSTPSAKPKPSTR